MPVCAGSREEPKREWSEEAAKKNEEACFIHLCEKECSRRPGTSGYSRPASESRRNACAPPPAARCPARPASRPWWTVSSGSGGHVFFVFFVVLALTHSHTNTLSPTGTISVITNDGRHVVVSEWRARGLHGEEAEKEKPMLSIANVPEPLAHPSPIKTPRASSAASTRRPT